MLIIPLINALLTHAVEQIINKSSRAGIYLDLIFCSSFLLYDDVMCLQPFSTSDHCIQNH